MKALLHNLDVGDLVSCIAAGNWDNENKASHEKYMKFMATLAIALKDMVGADNAVLTDVGDGLEIEFEIPEDNRSLEQLLKYANSWDGDIVL